MLKSIRNKLFLSHIASILALILLVILVIIDIGFLQTQMSQGYSVSKIQAIANKLTLQEEKILLERERKALPRLQHNVKQLNKLLEDYEKSLKSLFDKDEVVKLRRLLDQYEALLDKHQDNGGIDLLALSREFRKLNDDIRELIAVIGVRHHRIQSETADLVSLTLGIGVIFIVAIALLSAVLVIRLIVKPLRNLERQLGAVANNKISKLTTKSNDSELLSFVSGFNNMLDKLKAQEKLIRNDEKAKAVNILVSGVAHELNNPLSNISTSAQLLLEEDAPRPELRHEWLLHIDSEIERARKIVRRLLDSVRHQNQPHTCVPAAQLVQGAVSLIHRQIDPKITIDIEDITETRLSVNYERFKQVFINLIKNSVDAGARNISVIGHKVTQDDVVVNNLICAKEKIEGNKQVDSVFLFTIADDGDGIPEENISNLFTPFFSTKSGGEGTGLGLYIVNEIVMEHGGCISVKNRDGGGCEFLLLLPLSKETQCEN